MNELQSIFRMTGMGGGMLGMWGMKGMQNMYRVCHMSTPRSGGATCPPLSIENVSVCLFVCGMLHYRFLGGCWVSLDRELNGEDEMDGLIFRKRLWYLWVHAKGCQK